MAKSIDAVEPGIFWRLHRATGARGRYLSISYEVAGKGTVIESAKTTSVVEARKLRATRIAANATGVPIASASLTVNDLLDRVLAYYEKNEAAQLRTARGHVAAMRPAIGTMRAKDLRTEHLDAMVKRWGAITGKGHVCNVTINKRLGTLRRALNLAVEKRDLPHAPKVPMFGGKAAKSKRGKYIAGAIHALLTEYLPDFIVILADFARLYGIRKGQLSQTLRAWVDRDRAVIEWPPDTVKNDDPHAIPLDAAGLAIIDRLLADERPWCPYLFHGRHCAPGRKPNAKYGCVGDFKKAWNKACQDAGLPVGRKAGGYTFHHFRNTAVTDMLASGKMTEADAMKVSNHKTASMIRHYNLGNIEALRERLEESRREVERLEEKRRERAAAAASKAVRA